MREKKHRKPLSNKDIHHDTRVFVRLLDTVRHHVILRNFHLTLPCLVSFKIVVNDFWKRKDRLLPIVDHISLPSGELIKFSVYLPVKGTGFSTSTIHRWSVYTSAWAVPFSTVFTFHHSDLRWSASNLSIRWWETANTHSTTTSVDCNKKCACITVYICTRFLTPTYSVMLMGINIVLLTTCKCARKQRCHTSA